VAAGGHELRALQARAEADHLHAEPRVDWAGLERPTYHAERAPGPELEPEVLRLVREAQFGERDGAGVIPSAGQHRPLLERPGDVELVVRHHLPLVGVERAGAGPAQLGAREPQD
jgi:hypothetical protein